MHTTVSGEEDDALALVRVYCGLTSADPPAGRAPAAAELTVAVVDDAGRLVGVHEVTDDPAGYAWLGTYLVERSSGLAGLALAADSDDHMLTSLLAAAGRPFTVADDDSVDDFAERFADDDSAEEMQAPPAFRRAVGLARALQAGAIAAVTGPTPRELTGHQPILAAHAARVTGRYAAATALREVLRELYPAALRAFPDPSAPLPMAVLEALPEPGRMHGSVSRGRDADDIAAEVVDRLTAVQIADARTTADAVTALRVAISESPRRGGVNKTLSNTVADAVGAAVAAVRSCDAACEALLASLVARVTPQQSSTGRRSARRAAESPVLQPVPETGPSRIGRRSRPEPAAASAGPAMPHPMTSPPVAPEPLTPPPVAPRPVAPPPIAPAAATGPGFGAPGLPSRPTSGQPGFGAPGLPGRPTSGQPGFGDPPGRAGSGRRGSEPPSSPTTGQPGFGDLPGRPGSGPPAFGGSGLPRRPASDRSDSDFGDSGPAARPASGFGDSGLPVRPTSGVTGRPVSSAPPPPPGIVPSPRGGVPPVETGQPFRPTITNAAINSARAERQRTIIPPRPVLRPQNGSPEPPPAPTQQPSVTDYSSLAMPATRPPRADAPAPEAPAPGSRSNWPLVNQSDDTAPAPTSGAGRVPPPWQSDDLPEEPPSLRLVDPQLDARRSGSAAETTQFDAPPLRLIDGDTNRRLARRTTVTALDRSTTPPVPEGDGDLLIFAAARSAWFDGHSDENTVDWQSQADTGWRAAEQAAEPQVGAETNAGLPKRVPQANLVPGSPLRDERPLRIVRDAASIAAHTTGYFRGWRRGQEIGGYAIGGRPGREAAGGWDFTRDGGSRDDDFRSAGYPS